MMSDDPEDRGEYECNLYVLLQGCVDTYEQAREKYWQSRLDAEEWSQLNQDRRDADEIAKLIRNRAYALRNVGNQSDLNDIYRVYHENIDKIISSVAVKVEDISGDNTWMNEILARYWKSLIDPGIPLDNEEDPVSLIWERICIDEAWDMAASMDDRIRRIFELERLIYEELGKEEPPEPSVRFLSLISRNYIYGFDTECVVMCRSAIDTAFRESVSEEHCKRAGRHRGKHGFHLADRICATFHPGNHLLEGRSDLYKSAQEVQERGNKAVHYDPDATKDVLGTIRSALRVINALSECAESA